jgi:hypothetical protein
MSKVTKNLNHILIASKPLVDAFEIDGHVYKARGRVPASVMSQFFAGSETNRVQAMLDFVTGSLEFTDGVKFAAEVYPQLDLQGLDEIVTVIMEVTSPLEEKK